MNVLTEINNFVDCNNLTDCCNWLIANRLIIGGYPSIDDLQKLIEWGVDIFISLIEPHEIMAYEGTTILRNREYVRFRTPNVLFVSYPTIDGQALKSDKTLSEIVVFILKMLKRDKKIYLHCLGGHGRSAVVGTCALMAYFHIDCDQALEILRVSHSTRKINGHIATPQSKDQIEQILRYRPPIKVIVCGDRNSYYEFEDIVNLELHRLPLSSMVITGGCKGIDTLGASLAKKLGLRLKIIPADWNSGKAAGPLRNTQMINMLDPDFDIVLAFHPDIKSSRGTLDCITQAFNRGIKVYLLDTKEKREFNGTTDDL
jgi:hypothetical protein